MLGNAKKVHSEPPAATAAESLHASFRATFVDVIVTVLAETL